MYVFTSLHNSFFISAGISLFTQIQDENRIASKDYPSQHEIKSYASCTRKCKDEARQKDEARICYLNETRWKDV